MRQRGFTLIELMIVVAIIAILCSIAIPNLLRARASSAEATAVENLRQIAAAEVTFHGSNQRFGTFAEMSAPPAGPAFIDSSWADNVVKNNYIYTIPTVTPTSFVCFASPLDPGTSGNRFFRIDAAGVVRYSATGAPTDTDTSLGS